MEGSEWGSATGSVLGSSRVLRLLWGEWNVER